MRTIFIGDIHGCADELRDLLDHVKYQAGDSLVLVGDIVVRGPLSKRVVEIARRENARVVRGNHDARVLQARGLVRDQASNGKKIRPEHALVARELDEADWAFLAATPLWIDLPSHGARALHAGLDPNKEIQEQDERTLLTVRYAMTTDGREVLWGELYEGPPHVVFGHHALEGLQMHRWATGLDTGCVYGGRLTALVLDRDETIPVSPKERRGHVVSVPARATYCEPKK